MKKYLWSNWTVDCAVKLESAVRKLAGVQSVSVDFSTQTMLLECHSLERVRQEIARLEPEVRVEELTQPVEEFSEMLHHRHELTLLGVSAFLFILSMRVEHVYGHAGHHFGEYALYLLTYLLVGGKVIGTALRNISRGRVFDESFLMTISTLGALAIHAPAEAVGVMLFYRLANPTGAFRAASRRSIRALLKCAPKKRQSYAEWARAQRRAGRGGAWQPDLSGRRTHSA